MKGGTIDVLSIHTKQGRTFASYAGDRGSIPGRDRPKSSKQVVTAPLQNAR